MQAIQPLYATEATAAKLLDLNPQEFRTLVSAGHLPRGREIAPGLVRWPVDDLRRISTGSAVEGLGDVTW